MKTFTTFREDLASGRPAKKPVSSNLLKQRAKENEKALATGFMKLTPKERAKESKRLGEEEMKPHKMFKGDKVVVAKNKEEHDKLNKQGYTHDDPKTKKIEEAKEMCSCDCPCGKAICESCGKAHRPEDIKESTRDNYNPVVSAKVTKEKLKKVGLPTEPPIVKEAKKPIVHFKGKDSLKTVKIKYNKPIKTKVTDIGPGGKEVVRKDWSEGIERDSKSNSFNRTKAKTSKVRIGQKRDKKTGKMVDVMGTSTAPQGFPKLKEEQIRVLESLTNLVSRGVGNVKKFQDSDTAKQIRQKKTTAGVKPATSQKKR